VSVAVDPVDNTNIERHDVVGGTSAPHQGTTADIGASPSGATATAGVPASCVAGGDTAAADVASAQRKARLAAEAATRQQTKIDNCRFYHEALNHSNSTAKALIDTGLDANPTRLAGFPCASSTRLGCRRAGLRGSSACGGNCPRRPAATSTRPASGSSTTSTPFVYAGDVYDDSPTSANRYDNGAAPNASLGLGSDLGVYLPFRSLAYDPSFGAPRPTTRTTRSPS